MTALLFARYRADAGTGSLPLQLDDDATVRSAAAAVSRSTGVRLEGAMCAINERYCRPEDPLAEGDRVAFLPPVSGG